jgi:NADH:ubiquinone oxidoreductase subunit K
VDAYRDEVNELTIGGSFLLIALGAILRFAITPQYTHGVNLGIIGVILMIVGAAGLIISLAVLTMRRRTDVTYRRDGTTYVEPGPIDPRI